MYTRWILAAILALAPAGALAQGQALYGGVQLGDYEFEIPPVSPAVEDPEPAAIVGRLGYRFNRTLALEGRYGDTATHDPLVAVFARVAVPFRATDVYFLLGASEIRPNGVAIEEQSNVATGVGIELYGSRGMSFGLEYVRYSDEALRGVGIGFTFEFAGFGRR